MAIDPLNQRLDSILQPAPTMGVDEAPQSQPEAVEQPDLTEPGQPDMEGGIQVAGPSGAAIRKLIRSGEKKPDRRVMPTAPEGEVPEAGQVGRFKVVPEADQPLAEKVGQAVDRRQKFSPLTGKPGGSPEEAFNLSRFADRDAAGVVAGVSDALGIQTKRVTFAEIKAKAAESGISESFLARLVGADGKMMPSAVETYKALEVLETSAGELDRLFKLVNAGDATDSQKLQLRQQIAFHAMVQKAVKGMQSETARALAVFKIPREGNASMVRQVLEDYGGDKSLQDLAQTYLTIESRAARNKLVEKTMFSSLKDVWFTTFINGLLSGPATHAKNIAGNTLFGLWQIPERLVGAFYGRVLPNGVRSWRATIPGSAKDKIELDEALIMLQSLRTGAAEGLQMAATAFRKNAPSDAASKIDLQRQQRESVGETLQRITGASPESFLGKGLDFYGTAITLPGRALMTEDEFFKGVFYRMEMNAQVLRRSRKVYRDAIESGMTESEAAAKMTLEARNLMDNPPADLEEAAVGFAQRGTFNMELPDTLKALQKTFNHPALKVLVPFFKVIANIGIEVTERTPFAAISKRWRDDFSAGGPARDMALAKMSMGSLALYQFASYAAEGRISGAGPARKADRDALMRTGWRPYSVKVGDQWISYSGMEPVSALMAIAANYAEYAAREPDDDKIAEVFLGAVHGMMDFLKDQPYMQGMADVSKFMEAAEGDRTAAMWNSIASQYGRFVIGGSPGGAYNSMVASINRLIDPTVKDVKASPDLPLGVRGFVEGYRQYRSRIPYFNSDLPDRLNLWGDKMMSGQGVAYEFVLPTRVSPVQFDEVDDALVRMGSPINMPSRKLKGVEMDSYQYNRLLTIYGKELNAKSKILETIRSPGFDLLTLDVQQNQVQLTHRKLMDAATNQLVLEDAYLAQKIGEMDEVRKAFGNYYKPQ